MAWPDRKYFRDAVSRVAFVSKLYQVTVSSVGRV